MHTFNKFLLPTMFGLLLASGVSTFAHAADPVTLNITGNVVASPCEISADSKNMNIDLGKGMNLQSSVLNGEGSSSEWVPFSVSLVNCPAGTSSVTATFHGTSDENDVETLYSNTGTAENVAVQLEGVASEPYGNGKTSTLSIASAAAVWKLQTRAYSTAGNVTPGSISSVITMSIAYN